MHHPKFRFLTRKSKSQPVHAIGVGYHSCLLQCYHYQASHVWPWNVQSASGKYVWFSFIRGFSASKATGEPSTRMLWSQREKLLAALPGRDYQGLEEEDLWREECIGRLAMQWLLNLILYNGPLAVAWLSVCGLARKRAGSASSLICLMHDSIEVLWNSHMHASSTA